MKIGYCRVSTSSGEQLSALESQIARVENAGVVRVITDIESGLSNERQGMNELLSLIDGKQVTEVVATRVDRLGRDASATDALILLAGRKGVKITTLDGGAIEAETPTGFLMSRLTTSLAEMESKMLSLRIKRGLEQRRKDLKPCRGKAPWGYQISTDKSRIERNIETWDTAQRFLDSLRANNWRMQRTLDDFQEPCPLSATRSVKAWLKNPILRGGLGYGRRKDDTFERVVWDLHDALLSHQEYTVIKLKMEENRAHWGNNAQSTPKLLTGLVRCPNCKRNLRYAGGRARLSMICNTSGCESRYKGTYEAVISDAVKKELIKRATDLAQRIEVQEPPEAEALRQQISKLEALDDDDLTDAIETKKQKLREVMTTSSPMRPDRAAALAEPAAWEMATPEELRLIYLEFVERVEADRGEVVSVRLKI